MPNEAPTEISEDNGAGGLVKLYTFFLLMFQSLFRVSDTAINVLFALFFSTIVRSMPKVSQSFVASLPLTKSVACCNGKSIRAITKYVCCPSCHSIYDWNDCIVSNADGQLVSKLYSFRRFPNHTQRRHHNECGQCLMKTVRCGDI